MGKKGKTLVQIINTSCPAGINQWQGRYFLCEKNFL
jgi:hypothetical protein